MPVPAWTTRWRPVDDGRGDRLGHLGLAGSGFAAGERGGDAREGPDGLLADDARGPSIALITPLAAAPSCRIGGNLPVGCVTTSGRPAPPQGWR